ncbi:MAG: TraB/GumN family protein [Prevotella sp.]|nr:TraB/GumN family protein [Prevotella sp.]
MTKKLLSLLLLSCLCTLGANAQLLYRISGNGLERPSYIVGSHHLISVTFVDSIPGVHEAMDATAQAYGELSFDNMLNPDSIAYLQTAMMLPDGKHLKDILTAEQYEKLNEGLRSILTTDLNNPMLEAQMGRMLPLGIVTQLTIINYMMKHPSAFDPTKPFDRYFLDDAKQKGKPVGGFETVAYQTEALFKSTTLSRQVELLMCYIGHLDWSENMNEAILKAYRAQDLATVKKAMDEKINDSCDSTPEEDAIIIDNRNANWLKKMPAIMSDKPTFFVVGAGHLPGNKGVLQGLRNLGYTVEGVK